jgi:hypothetical protein
MVAAPTMKARETRAGAAPMGNDMSPDDFSKSFHRPQAESNINGLTTRFLLERFSLMRRITA